MPIARIRGHAAIRDGSPSMVAKTSALEPLKRSHYIFRNALLNHHDSASRAFSGAVNTGDNPALAHSQSALLRADCPISKGN